MQNKPTTTDLCARIQAAAIKCDTYHVFVSYSPHVSALTVHVRESSHDYSAETDDWPEPLLYKSVSLTGSGAIAGLTDVIDQLQRLGVEV